MRTFSIIGAIALSLGCAITNTQGAFPTSDHAQVLLTSKGVTYTDCGSPSDPIQIESIEVIPNPPKPGQDFIVQVQAQALDVIEEGAYADVLVKLGLIKLLHKQFDLCEEARNANSSIQCPVEPGRYTVEQKVTLPREVPQAKFTVNVRGYTVDDDDLVCLDLVADFLPHPF